MPRGEEAASQHHGGNLSSDQATALVDAFFNAHKSQMLVKSAVLAELDATGARTTLPNFVPVFLLSTHAHRRFPSQRIRNAYFAVNLVPLEY